MRGNNIIQTIGRSLRSLFFILVSIKVYQLYFFTMYFLQYELFFNIPPFIFLFFYFIITIYLRFLLRMVFRARLNPIFFLLVKVIYILNRFNFFCAFLFIKKIRFYVLTFFSNKIIKYWEFRYNLAGASLPKCFRHVIRMITVIYDMGGYPEVGKAPYRTRVRLRMDSEYQVREMPLNSFKKFIFNIIHIFLALTDISLLFFFNFFELFLNIQWRPINIRLPYFKKINSIIIKK